MEEEKKESEEKTEIPGAEQTGPDFFMRIGPTEVGFKFDLKGGKMQLAIPPGELSRADIMTALAAFESAAIPFSELIAKMEGGKACEDITWN